MTRIDLVELRTLAENELWNTIFFETSNKIKIEQQKQTITFLDQCIHWMDSNVLEQVINNSYEFYEREREKPIKRKSVALNVFIWSSVVLYIISLITIIIIMSILFFSRAI